MLRNEYNCNPEGIDHQVGNHKSLYFSYQVFHPAERMPVQKKGGQKKETWYGAHTYDIGQQYLGVSPPVGGIQGHAAVCEIHALTVGMDKKNHDGKPYLKYIDTFRFVMKGFNLTSAGIACHRAFLNAVFDDIIKNPQSYDNLL